MTTLQDKNTFDFMSGLWTGKRPPFSKAVVIRNTNFREDGQIDYTKIAELDVETKQLKTRTLRKGDIILERSGGSPKQPVGRVVYFENDAGDVDYSFSNFTSAIRVKDTEVFDSKYVFYFLHNFYREGKTDHLQRRTTGIRNLDFTAYKEAVVFPSIDVKEQKSVVRVLTTVQDAIAEQERLIEKLKELKRSIMHHLFTRGIKGEKTKMTEIGEIPESWEVAPLSKLISSLDAGVSVKSGDRPIREKEKGVLKTSCVTLGIFDAQENKAVSGGELKRLSTPLNSDTILISRMNTLSLVGATAYVEQGNPNLYLPDRLWQVSLIDPRGTSMKWLAYLLETMWKSGQFSAIASGTSASMKNITKGKLLSLVVAIPGLPEQQAIAHTINAVDKKMLLTVERLAVYHNLFKTLLHELMSGERRINY